MSFKLSKINKPFIIAELSANHNGKISNVFKLINEAKKCGANAIKIQSYTPDSMTIDSKNKYFYINKGPWKGNYLFDLYIKLCNSGRASSILSSRVLSNSAVYFWKVTNS